MSRAKPLLQRHLKLPMVFLHFPWVHIPGKALHSLISESRVRPNHGAGWQEWVLLLPSLKNLSSWTIIVQPWTGTAPGVCSDHRDGTENVSIMDKVLHPQLSLAPLYLAVAYEEQWGQGSLCCWGTGQVYLPSSHVKGKERASRRRERKWWASSFPDSYQYCLLHVIYSFRP